MHITDVCLKLIVLLEYIDLFLQHIIDVNITREDSQPYCNNLPIVLAYATSSAKTLHVRMQILTYFYNFKML